MEFIFFRGSVRQKIIMTKQIFRIAEVNGNRLDDSQNAKQPI